MTFPLPAAEGVRVLDERTSHHELLVLSRGTPSSGILPSRTFGYSSAGDSIFLKRSLVGLVLTKGPAEFPVAVVRLLKTLAVRGVLRRALKPRAAGVGCRKLLRIA